MMDKPVRITLFDDNEDRRKSLRYLFSLEPGLDLVGEFPDCIGVLDKVGESKPDVILMDIQMPGISGVEAVEMIKTRYPEIPILMQTVFEDEEIIFRAIKAGASGYLLKNEEPERIIRAIKELVEGGAPMTPTVATKVLHFFRTELTPADYSLTDREKEILKFLSDGLSYKLIATKLNISPHTVNSHIRKIYEKLHVRSLGEAISKAIRERLI